ncbi:hypothetical protein H696_05184 [Fonticula alba]|uniref:Golgi apparatus membrane protein TVP18 n=1 Tax=Fonticula alba TaxID=691883 RepID=A0A058Z3Z6_FONAL|nr:hypothetical protein H696_05184 [Fonticula alba]KCV68262.1 hypothetical protein H696_05184 [Fonticula alba]|eukprot:XP_009497316.1 hypothetical protein H696_05184 [Fonticula alba]
MGCLDELRSGQFSIYGQWVAIASIVLLFIFSLVNIIGTLIIFAILGIVISIFMLLIEIPFFTVCCKTPLIMKSTAFFDKLWVRSILYLAFGALMMCTVAIKVSTLIVPAITLLAAALLYMTALCKRETRSASTLTGGQGVVSNSYQPEGAAPQNQLV